MPTPNLTSYSDAELADQLLEAEADKDAADKAAKKIKNELVNRHLDKINAKLKAKDEPFGAASFDIAGYKATANLPKKVEWDQEKLKSMAQTIIADGGKVEDYIDIEYSIPEKRWGAWGDNFRAFFAEARTVTPGNMTIKIEKSEE